MKNTLKNCPCCNGKAIPMQSIRKYFTFHIVICSDCGMRTSDCNSRESAAKTWNKRILKED